MGIADSHMLSTSADSFGDGATVAGQCSCGHRYETVSFRVAPGEPIDEVVEDVMACVLDAHEHHVAVVQSDETLAAVRTKAGADAVGQL